MSGKQDSPIPKSKTGLSRTTSNVKTTLTPNSISNADLLSAMNTVKSEILLANKEIADRHDKQIDGLRSDFKRAIAQISELKLENARLRKDIESLDNKISNLETRESSNHSSSNIGPVLQELFERERCSSNIIVYEIPESSSTSINERVANDKHSINNIVQPLGLEIPINSKIIRLGKPRLGTNRPVKIICDNKETVARFLSEFNSQKTSGKHALGNFRFVRDKTPMQRKLLRSCHEELESRTQNGESNLKIIYVNGEPKVMMSLPKNEGSRHQTTQP